MPYSLTNRPWPASRTWTTTKDGAMRGKGITYDTGFRPAGGNSRPTFAPAEVLRDMRVIADQLHCTCVRVTGADPDRLTVAARYAAAAGLDVWFSPFPCQLDQEQMLDLFRDCAERAEALRRTGAAVVFVAGCELTLFARGFVAGDTLVERIATAGSESDQPGDLAAVQQRLRGFLGRAAAVVRTVFHGPITYASGLWEEVDWSPFDIVSVDAYRDAHNQASYNAQVATYVALGKPVAITEFGCCTYRGAARRGGTGWAIVDRDSDPPRLTGSYVRDEVEQAAYLTELLGIFDELGIDSAFWFTYASWSLPHHPDPRFDLDLAGYGLSRVTERGLEPKRAFRALAAAYI